ncbi:MULTISPECIES: lytic transglycosylase domain-containing protein [Heyndrickxia]|jgi:peptidyl-tRNA hydrolase|uniref:Lytic transglycosylase catalytic n=2 Tax=Heyndrickxia coagulans TaxID=1398 RepID=G2TMR7_HEYCO|nr:MULTISPECIES: lytic transglycosylase domain-containing protein [Heyndrickxia]NWN94172.1 transglycosylase SLT domain-containing protein [Bacillus sp. (in: firmicutes)]AEO99558.1 Lytic transglycosylase catalytic [Heyndrickxia coagulans 36D1]AWP36440.1 lytic transglycosylase [Heyndrickxia coagulans]KWZ77849.1 transglycosylase SLT domain protein [Heyndrickxia coagulans]MBQ4911649.1 transglycosylase SLT domain-containing protein [Heyndrickxia faecalis]
MSTISQLASLMELEALRSLSPGSNAAQTGNSTSLFQEMLSSFLEEAKENETAAGASGKDESGVLSSLAATLNPAFNSLSSLTGENPVLTTLPAFTGLSTLSGKATAATAQAGTSAAFSASAQNSASESTQTTAASGSGGIPAKISQAIQQASEKYGVPEKLIQAVIKQESGYRPDAVSAAGAAGLMQLMPETAASLGVSNVLDPEQNVDAGTKYLKSLLGKYDHNVQLALAAYNAGPGNVDRYGGIPPFKETQKYVSSIMNHLA